MLQKIAFKIKVFFIYVACLTNFAIYYRVKFYFVLKLACGKCFVDEFVKKIFKNKKIDSKKLVQFGFKFNGTVYVYSQKLLKNQFELFISIKNEDNIETKLIDCESKELYTLHLFSDAEGTFIGKVREVYENILEDIAEKCCENTYFSSSQSNRIADCIKTQYKVIPEFLWEKSPGCGVFRNQTSKKWFGIVMDIDKSKLDKKQKGLVEVLNIKLDKDEIQQLLLLKFVGWAYSPTINRTFTGLPKIFDFSNIQANLKLLFVD